MTEMDLNRAQVLRQQLVHVVRGKSIHDAVGAIEMLIVDVLTGLPGVDEVGTLAGFDAMARDVRNIIRERFATQGKGH